MLPGQLYRKRRRAKDQRDSKRHGKLGGDGEGTVELILGHQKLEKPPGANGIQEETIQL